MGVFSDIKNLLTPHQVTEEAEEVISSTGQVIDDKRSVEDPTGKFSGPRYVQNIYRTKLTQRNVQFYKPEYDLPMIANAIQLDGLLRRATNIFVEHILKNGYEAVSKTDRIQKHVNRRIREIESLTGVSFYETIEAITTQLVTYGNAYLLKERSGTKSRFGKDYKMFGKSCKPIVGLFPVEATTIEIGVNNTHGNVRNYKQVVKGQWRIWDERDVIHFTYDKIPGTLSGMSALLPILDDIRALRKLEEEIEILGFQYSIPLYLYKVGNKDVPPAPGEVEEVSQTVTNMPAYGMLVVPGHHTIEIPSNSNETIDIIKYAEHFKKRIYGGLGVSPVAMGEVSSSNRNTAEVTDKAMQSITQSYQMILKNKIEMELIRELMLDGGFNTMNEKCEFNFPEIDLENQIKQETHIVQLWQNNIITRSEARLAMDKEANIDEKDTFLNMVDIPKIEAETKSAIAIEKAKPKPTTTGGGSTVSKKKTSTSTSKAAKKTSNKVAPANQHGKATRPKYVKNEVLIDGNAFSGLSIFNKLEFTDQLSSTVLRKLRGKIDYTITKYCQHYQVTKPDQLDERILDKYLSGIGIILEDRVERASRYLDDEQKLSMLSKYTKQFLDEQDTKIDSLAKILLYKSLGYKTILVNANECPTHMDTNLDLSRLDYSRIPPFEYQCNCKVEEESLNEF